MQEEKFYSPDNNQVEQMYFENGDCKCQGDTCEKFEYPASASGDYALKSDIDRLELELKNKANLTDQKKHVATEVIDGMLIDEDIPVIGESVGSYSEGSVVTNGTTLEAFIKNLLQKKIPASYVTPTLQLTANRTSYEIGSYIDANLNINYLKNDGGNVKSYVLLKDNTPIQLNQNSTFSESFTLGKPVVYQATAAYDAGPIKTDNVGTPCPNGQIQAGEARSNTITITPYRNVFFGASPNVSMALTNDNLRAAQTFANPTMGSSITLVIPVYTKLIFFALPKAIIPDVKSVIYKEAGNVDVKVSFKKTTVSINGANNNYPTDYDVYFYTADSYFSTTATYIINI